MNILNIEHVSKIYGEKTIFDDASFGIHEGEKIGIIGINGTGKTTLLRMAAGLEEPDEGQIIRQNGLRIAYLPQNPEFPEGATIQSYIEDAESENSWMVQSNLTRLGIMEYDTPIAHLSGGQKKKVALAKILETPADLLLLDEPTNHLDNEMITWLEDYLRGFRGVVLMVTHDRYFLDRVTNKILEISHGKMYGYEANYSKFLELKAEREEMELASERKRQSILRIELEWAKRGCRARTTKQRARLERLEALKNGQAPVQDQNVELDSVETRMGRKTIELHHISKSYGKKKLVEDFDYSEKPEGWFYRTERLRKINAAENDCGDRGAGQRYGGDRRDGADRLLCPGTAGTGHAPEGHRLCERHRGIRPDQRRKDYGVPDAGAVSFYSRHAVCAHRKAFRRGEKAPVSSWNSSVQSQLPDPG